MGMLTLDPVAEWQAWHLGLACMAACSACNSMLSVRVNDPQRSTGSSWNLQTASTPLQDALAARLAGVEAREVAVATREGFCERLEAELSARGALLEAQAAAASARALGAAPPADMAAQAAAALQVLQVLVDTALVMRCVVWLRWLMSHLIIRSPIATSGRSSDANTAACQLCRKPLLHASSGLLTVAAGPGSEWRPADRGLPQPPA
jgi:hypothetical protein